GGPEKFEGKKRKGTSFQSMPPPVETKKRTDTKPGDMGALDKLIERDYRKGKMQQRVESMITTELTRLECHYKSAPAKSKDKPQLTLRLAEAYAELEQSAIREKIAADIQIQDAKKKKKNTSALRKEVAKSKQMEKAARAKAIAYYKAMAKN